MFEGPDFPVLYCVAVLRHLQERILHAAQQQRLLELLYTTTIDFRIRDSAGYIETLREKYKGLIAADLQATLKLRMN
jgi:hypothetical protein